MLSKINFFKIIIDHFQTHKNFSDGKTNINELISFYIIPLATGLFLVFSEIFIKESIADILITSFSIFTALLLNLLLLVFNIIRKNLNSGCSADKVKNSLLKQVYSNISYSILISIFSLFSLLFLQVIPYDLFHKIINLVIYFMALNFILTLLQILKRIHILLSNEF